MKSNFERWKIWTLETEEKNMFESSNSNKFESSKCVGIEEWMKVRRTDKVSNEEEEEENV